jgi:hypothetical protein
MHALKLLRLHCHVPDETGFDEVYLKLNGDQIWPQTEKYLRLNIGETTLNLDIEDTTKGDIVEIELWDYDTFSKDDKLGTFPLHLDQFGSFKSEMKKLSGTPASYSLEWEYY